MRTDTYVDGGGVLNDQPLTPGAWIRFVLDPTNRDHDVTAHIENGTLVIRGMWRPLEAHRDAGNALTVRTI